MSVILGSTGITFPDATTQTTKTPTVVSAFTNDAGYVTSSALSSYATRAQAVGSLGTYSNGHGGNVVGYNINGTLITDSGGINCNCNC